MIINCVSLFPGLGSLWLDLSSLLQRQSRDCHLHTLILYHPSHAQPSIDCITPLKRVLHSPRTDFAHRFTKIFGHWTWPLKWLVKDPVEDNFGAALIEKANVLQPACVRLKNARFAVTFRQTTEKGPRVHRTNCAASSKQPIAFEFRQFEEAGSFAFVDWVNFCSGLLAAMIQHACAVLNVSAMWTRRWHGLHFFAAAIPSGKFSFSSNQARLN